MWKRSAVAALGLVAIVSVTGCSEVNEAVNQVDNASSKAQVCTEALGLVNLNPNVDPEQVQAGAEEKANRLRELGNQVADQSVRETLSRMADGYQELGQQQLDNLQAFDDWLSRNLRNLEQLRQACL
ncbi:hypothetical protein SacmaDRAFT_5065 [Saccharomonospora marina XMU15]|uniref:Uncharacterized protein n=1 Tax=Saccharomonospora marina XMU15 TaxID=882083 RepID=H5X334_9PSEU|nr:hypothetical protein [Saccharomonospora marina]EHR53233.1 hypothetical protein SacmaDRAFT_5065 [Saccharomonospora marina XMU15]